MKIETYSFPKSSFLAVDKDMELLVFSSQIFHKKKRQSYLVNRLKLCQN